MSTLLEKANEILAEKNSKILPANIKNGTEIFNVTGTYTSDANATENDILIGKTAYVNGQKIIGTYEGPIPTYTEISFNVDDKMIIDWNMIAISLESQLTAEEKAMYIPMNNCHEAVLIIGGTPDENYIDFYLDTESDTIDFSIYDTATGDSSFTGVDTTNWSISGEYMTVQEFINNLKLIPVNDKLICTSNKDINVLDNKITIVLKDELGDGILKDIAILSSNYLEKEEQPEPPGPTPIPGTTIQFTQGDTVMINWAMIIDALETQLSSAEKSKLVYDENACNECTVQLSPVNANEDFIGFQIDTSNSRFVFCNTSNSIFVPETSNWSSYADLTAQNLINNLKLIPVSDRPIVTQTTEEYTLFDNYSVRLKFNDGTYKDITLPGDYIFINPTDPYEYTIVENDNIKFNGDSLASALDAQLTAEEKAKNILTDGSGQATIVTGFMNTMGNYNMYDELNSAVGLEAQSTDSIMLFVTYFTVTLDYFEGDYTAQNLINLLADDTSPVKIGGEWVTYPNMIELVFEDETKKKIWLTEPIFEIVQNQEYTTPED